MCSFSHLGTWETALHFTFLLSINFPVICIILLHCSTTSFFTVRLFPYRWHLCTVTSKFCISASSPFAIVFACVGCFLCVFFLFSAYHFCIAFCNFAPLHCSLHYFFFHILPFLCMTSSQSVPSCIVFASFQTRIIFFIFFPAFFIFFIYFSLSLHDFASLHFRTVGVPPALPCTSHHLLGPVPAGSPSACPAPAAPRVSRSARCPSGSSPSRCTSTPSTSWPRATAPSRRCCR